ncbi:MAG: transposase [Deltaproteobacteria bacterium]
MDKSVTEDWAGARLYFDLVMLSYNLMNWFKEKALGREKTKEMAGTIRWRLIWIPAKLVKAAGRRPLLKLSSCWPFQEEFLRAKAALT